jgi:hypothetical protein
MQCIDRLFKLVDTTLKQKVIFGRPLLLTVYDANTAESLTWSSIDIWQPKHIVLLLFHADTVHLQ